MRSMSRNVLGWPLWLLVLVVCLSALAIALTGIHIASAESAFKAGITTCNTEPPHLRFSCYRSSLELLYKSNPSFALSMSNFVSEVSDKSIKFRSEDDDITYGHFGTNCHTYYHAVGDLIASHADADIRSLHALCPLTCTSGCAMGLHKRMALKSGFSDQENKDFYAVCDGSEKHQCTHEIGHSLQDKHVTSILGIIDGLSRTHYGLEQPEAYAYTLMDMPDIDAAFEDCRRLLPESELEYCYTGVGHNFFLYSAFSEQDYRTQIDDCAAVEEKNRIPCLAYLFFRIGINEAAPHFLNADYAQGVRVCDEVIAQVGDESLKTHCYKGIGGGLGLYLESEYVNYSQKQLYTKEMKDRILRAGQLCKKIENTALRQDCFLGLLGTKFKNYYDLLVLYDEEIDELVKWDLTGFQVTS